MKSSSSGRIFLVALNTITKSLSFDSIRETTFGSSAWFMKSERQ